MKLQIISQGLELRLASQAAGAHPRAARQIIQAPVFLGAEHVARIFTLGDCDDFEFPRNFRRQVFQAMHGQIDATLRQGLFYSLCEHAFRADLGKRHIGDFVARGFDNFNFHAVTTLFEECANVIGLPQRQLRTSGADAELSFLAWNHDGFSVPQLLLPGPPPDLAALFSSRLNKRRTTSITVVASGSRAAVFRVLIGVCMILFTIPRVSVSTAISCSGESGPRRARTRSISAWRMVSR